MGSQIRFPGPGTAMAFAAAVAAGAAGYSYSQTSVSCWLLVLALIFGVFTVVIEYMSGPYSAKKTEDDARKIENGMKGLDLIEKLHELSEKEIIAEEEFQKKKDEILSTF